MSILFVKFWRDIRRQAAQFTAVGLIAMLGVALYGASNDAYLNLKSSYASLFSRLRFADLQVTGGDTTGFVAAVASDAAVQRVHTRRVADAPLQVGGEDRLIGRLVGMPVTGQPSVDQLLVMKGGYLKSSEPSGVLVEQHFAGHFDLSPGSRLQVRDQTGWRDLKVLGVVASAEYIWPARSRQETLTSPDNFGVLFAPDQLVAEVAGPAAQDQVLVFLNSAHRNEDTLNRLKALAARFSPVDVTDRASQPSNASLSEDIDGLGEMAILFPVLFLGAAATTVYVLLTRLVHSQRTIIGTLLAFGVRPHQLLIHFLSFGFAVGLVGGVVGASLGLVLARLFTNVYTSAIAVPVTVIQMHPETQGTGVAMAVAVGALAALAPAMAAFRIPPAEAMRGVVPLRSGGRILLERVLPPLRNLPPAYLLAVRSVWRDRRRSLSTLCGVVLAATLMLVSWGMLDSIDVVLGQQFHQVQRQDAIAYAIRPIDARLVTDVSRAPGVAAAEQFAQLPSTLRHDGRSYQTALEAFVPGTRMHGFYGADGRSSSLPATGVLLGAALAQKLGIEAGDSVELQLISLGKTVTQPVRGFVFEALGSFAYISIEALARQIEGDDVANAVLVRYAPGVDFRTERRVLAGVPGIAAVVDTRATVNAFGEFLGFFYAFVGTMLAFGVAMAFGLIFATTWVNILERMQEFATLMTGGVRLYQLAIIVTSENLALVTTGLIPGLLVGHWAAGAFLATLNSDLFHFDAYVLPRSYMITVVAIMAAALLSELPALRAITRIDLAGVVRERAA